MNDNIRKQLHMPKSYPVLCELTIDAMKWYRFQQLNEHTPETNIVGYDDLKNGEITVWIACQSEDVKDALESGWC